MLELSLDFLMTCDPTAQRFGIEVMLHCCSGNRNAGLQAWSNRFVPRSIVVLATAISFPTNHQPATQVSVLSHTRSSRAKTADDYDALFPWNMPADLR
ncbi:hypothetical protein [Burkholderia sp. D-99]|uniref:hypothetical protein n=1 Tax=Burkholderia sp. D-99 TaxID=2717316 RepID=UPI001FB82BDB|nr:hypothetical protein [Burkholderia sp. D-99]